MTTIDILTGPVHSGKTTHLISWIKFHTHCAGILAPVVENKRQIYSIHDQLLHSLEAEDHTSDDEIVSIGNYRFLISSFEWARRQLQQAAELKPNWLIIDEIGPLELRGEGLEPQITEIIQNYSRSRKNRLILVIRELILEQALVHYNLAEIANIHESFLEII